MSENDNSDIRNSITSLEKSVAVLEERIKSERKTTIIVGAILLAIMGYTDIVRIPSEAGKQVKDKMPDAVVSAMNAWLKSNSAENWLSELKGIADESKTAKNTIKDNESIILNAVENVKNKLSDLKFTQIDSSTIKYEGVLAATKIVADEIVDKRTSEWTDLLVPSGWSSSGAACRFNNGWIEFKGEMIHPEKLGWPAFNKILLLPKVCRPTSDRYTEMPCHAGKDERPRNGVCNNDFLSTGEVNIFSDFKVMQQRFEGVRIWGM